MTLGAPQVIAEFDVAGIPRPQGSMRAFRHRTTGRIVMVASSSTSLAIWRHAVAEAAKAGRVRLWAGPVAVGITFRFARPKAHLNRSGLRLDAPRHPAGRGSGDVDKLSRAILDALVDADVIPDDSLVVRLAARKLYGDRPGASVRVVAETTA